MSESKKALASAAKEVRQSEEQKRLVTRKLEVLAGIRSMDAELARIDLRLLQTGVIHENCW